MCSINVLRLSKTLADSVMNKRFHSHVAERVRTRRGQNSIFRSRSYDRLRLVMPVPLETSEHLLERSQLRFVVVQRTGSCWLVFS